MSIFLQLITFLLLTSQANAAYLVEYSTYDGLTGKMRKETVYQVSASGENKAIQTRIYVDESNELREASFLLKNGKWELYGNENLPAALKDQLDRVNQSVPIRIPVDKYPSLKISPKPAAAPKPVAREDEEDSAGPIACEMASPEYVTCAGIIYRRDRSGSINSILRSLKPAAPLPTRHNDSSDEKGEDGTSSAI